MDMAAYQSWFNGLSKLDKVAALLLVMHSFTIAIRGLLIEFPYDSAKQWRLAYHLSEINHALTSAAGAILADRETYPGNALIEIIFDQTNYLELEGQCRIALQDAVRHLRTTNAGV